MKTSVAKLALFAGLLLVVQPFVGHFSTSKTRFWTRERLDDLLRSGAETIHFGDSVLLSMHPKDQDRRNIAELLAETRPDLGVRPLQHAGYHPVIYVGFVSYLARGPRRPKRIIVPVNLRTFSPMWNKGPHFQFQSERMRLRFGDLLYYGYRNPMAAFQVYQPNPHTLAEVRATEIFWNEERLGTVGQIFQRDDHRSKKERLGEVFVTTYMQVPEADNRMLEALHDISETCRESGVELVVYVTPVDYATGRDLLGEEFVKTIQVQVDRVRERCGSTAWTFLDFSRLLEAEHFNWMGSPNEHLKESGRRRLAEALAREIPR